MSVVSSRLIDKIPVPYDLSYDYCKLITKSGLRRA